MNYELILQVEAILDIKIAFEWYEKQKEGLGYELLEEIENCYKKLSLNPQYYTFFNEQYRRIKVHRFPYLLVYEVEENTVIVNSIYHESKVTGNKTRFKSRLLQ